jgi:hypothetical protein
MATIKNATPSVIGVFDSSLLAKAVINAPLTAEYVFGISQKEVQIKEGHQQMAAIEKERHDGVVAHRAWLSSPAGLAWQARKNERFQAFKASHVRRKQTLSQQVTHLMK